MGLDSYWKKTREGEPASVEGNFNVCGGLLSGHGNDSFRGKVYTSIVEAVSGESLYQEFIDADTVSDINDSLQSCSYEVARENADCGIYKEEWEDFKSMWDAHTKEGHCLVGWW